MAKGATSVDTRVAKTAAATSFEDEEFKSAGDNTRRRLAAANSRNKANSFWTSLLAQSSGGSGSAGAKQTLG